MTLASSTGFQKVQSPTAPYNLTPYTEEDVREALKGKSKSSSPGEDQILYGYLTKLTKTHELMATIFTLIRDSGVAPEAWGQYYIDSKRRKERESIQTIQQISGGKLYIGELK